MLATEFLHGQGLGNQLFAYVTTRVLARRLGYDFGIKGLQNAGDSRVNKKGFYFMNLDYGKEVPDDLEIYFEYRHALHTDEYLRTDLRLTDRNLLSIPDNHLLHGIFQSEDYFYNEYKKTLKRKLGKPQRYKLFTLRPEHVAEKVVHALTSDRPKRRYLVTYPAYAGYIMSRILPDFAIDYFMKKSVNF